MVDAQNPQNVSNSAKRATSTSKTLNMITNKTQTKKERHKKWVWFTKIWLQDEKGMVGWGIIMKQLIWWILALDLLCKKSYRFFLSEFLKVFKLSPILLISDISPISTIMNNRLYWPGFETFEISTLKKKKYDSNVSVHPSSNYTQI